MNSNPLVSVVCLCYNHEQFLEEAILSVVKQSYANVEIIVIDDCSTDKSQDLLQLLKSKNPFLQVILHHQNKGNCKSFNEGLALAKGKYIIDFATDDMMLPNRIEEQVRYFKSLTDDFGVVYSNSELIDTKGDFLTIHADTALPKGVVFSKVLERHIYEPSTMMVRTDFFKEIGGYNEQLAYEDFDFVLRTSRLRKVGYLHKVLTKRRKSGNSLSTQFHSVSNEKMIYSTFLVCKEVFNWCKSTSEKKSWKKRVRHEVFFALKKGCYNVVEQYVELFKNEGILFLERFFLCGITNTVLTIKRIVCNSEKL